MLFEEALAIIDRGREGQNEGLFHGYPKLMNYIPGVQKGTIYNVVGGTGSGKTSFALSTFVFNPFEDYMRRKMQEDISLEIIVWSMEMSKEILVTKGICRKIFKDCGLLVDINYVLSRGKNRISQEIYDKVLLTREYFEEFENVVTILTAANPTGIHKTIKSRALLNGKEFFKPLTIYEDGVPREVKQFDYYKPNRPNHYFIAVQDHIALQKSESQLSRVKELIDKLVIYLIDDKLRYGISDVLVQQINRNSESVDRMRNNSIEVQLSDLRDSSDSGHASDFILGLSNPFAYEISPYRDYDITQLKDRFRGLKIVKSRDGIANIVLGLAYLGETGVLKELKPGKEMSLADYEAIVNIKRAF